MTALLDRPPARPSVPTHSAAQTWAGQWRVALRLARRDAWRAKGRSLLVLLIVGLPVMIVCGAVVATQQSRASTTPRAYAAAQLGTVADALVSPQRNQGVAQSMFGESVGSGNGPAPTLADVTAALPPGSRLVPAPDYSRQLIFEAGTWGLPGAVVAADLSDPLLASYWPIVEGRYPTAPGEALLAEDTAARLRIGVGERVSVGGVGDDRNFQRDLLVVGLADPAPLFGAQGVVMPGEVPIPPAEGAVPGLASLYLVESPEPVTWDVVRRVNAAGAFVTSRAVVADPPAFCVDGVICLDDGPAPQGAQEPDAPTASPDELARDAALGAVVVVLVVLQVALLAGPAFAVQLRRRQRELGLVGASGGDTRVLRRTVLASGVVLGVVASLAGAALGWSLVALASQVRALWPLIGVFNPVGLPTFSPLLLAVAAIGIVAAVSAAMVPAVVAGRGDVVDALRGRRKLPALRRGFPFLGLGVGALGLAVMAYGVLQLDPLVLGVGLIAAQLGVVLLMPWLVVLTGRVGRRLPLSARLAVRDSGRHRMRTTAAACAIAAAAAAAVGVSAAYGTANGFRPNNDVVVLPGVVQIQVTAGGYDDYGRPYDLPTEATLDRFTGVVAAADADATEAFVADVAPAGDPSTTGGYAYISCGDQAAYEHGDPAAPPPCSGRRAGGYLGLMNSAGSVSPDDLDLVLGPAAPLAEARDALSSGKVLVLQPNAVVDGKVTLTVQTSNADGGMNEPRTVQVPAFEVLQGALPVSLLFSEESLARPELAPLLQESTTGVLLARPSAPDTVDRPTFADRVQLEIYRGQLAGGVTEGSSAGDPLLVVMLIGAGATALLALLAGLMVTSLALADGRADHATLQAVGAAPGVRRRIAAATAGYVALLGCLVGAASGLLGTFVLVPLFTGSRSGRLQDFGVPWAMLALVVVLIPLLTAAVAWVTTRSRVVLTRRLDS